MKRSVLVVSALLLTIGLWQTGEAAWIHAKAWLAYGLIDRAWRRTLAGEHGVRPWPSADFWPVAKLRFPSEDRELIVLSDASGRTLAFGPGHLPETARPGSGAHTVIAGHRDTHFAMLRDVRPGDRIDLQSTGGTWSEYRATGHSVIMSPEAPSLMLETHGTLTLVTCYAASPLGPTSGWLVVHAAPATVPARGALARYADVSFIAFPRERAERHVAR